MNWIMTYIIILQILLGEVLPQLICKKCDLCFCQSTDLDPSLDVVYQTDEYRVGAKLKIDSTADITMTCTSDEMPEVEQHFDLINASTLVIYNCQFPDIRQIISKLGIDKVEKLKLSSVILNGSLENKYLSNLESVHMLQITKTELLLTDESFEGTPYLKKLILDMNNMTEIPKGVFKQLKLLEVLDLGENNLTNIDSDLFDDIPLSKLYLDRNCLTTLNLTAQYLEYLNVRGNILTNFKLETLNAPKLKTLDLANNKIRNIISNNFFSSHNLFKVETIDLSNNDINRIDPGWVNFTNLNYIDLSGNKFTVLRLTDIHNINKNVQTTLVLDMQYNPLETIDFTDLETFAKSKSTLEKMYNIEINLNSDKFVCDCRNYELARYLHRQMPSNVYQYLHFNTTTLTCNDGLRTEFKNVNMDSLTTCDWNIFEDEDKTDCTSECECSYRFHDNSALMNCSNRNLTLAPEKIISSKNLNFVELNLNNNSITKLPNYEHFNIKKLNIGFNNLNTINITQLPEALMELHLEHNNITMISAIYDLNNTLTDIRNITMSNNPWMCDCDTLNFVREYSSKIFDLSEIKCHQSPTVLYADYANLTITENKCEKKSNTYKHFTVSMFFGVLNLVLLIVMLVIMYNNNNVRVWLYSHNIRWLTPSPLQLNTSQLNLEQGLKPNRKGPVLEPKNH